MVPIKPYTVTVYPVGQQKIGDGTVANPTIGSGVVVNCYLERSTPGEAYQAFGIELKMPAFIQCELSDAPTFTADAQVHLSATEVYKVIGRQEVHDAGGDADHVDVLLERVSYPL